MNPYCPWPTALVRLAALITLALSTWLAGAQAVTIGPFTIAGDGSRHLQFAGEATNYYVLYRGTAVTDITNPVHVVLGNAPATSMQDIAPQQDAHFYRVLTVPTNAPLDLDGDGSDDVAELLADTDPLRAPGLMINELDYDQVGTDANEFVEIYNASTLPASLSGLKLVFINGNNNVQYLSVDLSAAAAFLAPSQYLVVKSTNVTAAVGALTIDFISGQANIQNGAPDALAIFDTFSNRIVDALSYEGSVTAGVVTGAPGTYNFVEGTALSVTVADSDSVVGSLCRIPNGTDTDNANMDWAFSTTPTPGAANVP